MIEFYFEHFIFQNIFICIQKHTTFLNKCIMYIFWFVDLINNYIMVYFLLIYTNNQAKPDSGILWFS